jgi:hypothetical protein
MRLRVLSLMACILGMTSNLARPADLLIPIGAIWKYLDNGIEPGTAWRTNGFDDSGWLYGAAPLGYGDGDEITVVRSNRLYGTSIITTYFRHAFLVEEPLPLEVERDREGIYVLDLDGTPENPGPIYVYVSPRFA